MFSISIPSLKMRSIFFSKLYMWTHSFCIKRILQHPFTSFISIQFLWLFWYISLLQKSNPDIPGHSIRMRQYSMFYYFGALRIPDAPKIIITPCDENDHYRPHPPAPALAQPNRLIPRILAPPPLPLLPLPPGRTPWRCAYVVRRCPYTTIYIVIMRRKQWIK